MPEQSIWNLVLLRNGASLDLSRKGEKVRLTCLNRELKDLVCVGTFTNCGPHVVVATKEGLERWDGGSHSIPGMAFPKEYVEFEGDKH